MKSDKHKTSFMLLEENKMKLQKIAYREDKTQGEIVDELIEKHYKKYEKDNKKTNDLKLTDDDLRAIFEDDQCSP